jgi:hypothetical protein
LHELLHAIGDRNSVYHLFIFETLVCPKVSPPDPTKKRVQLINDGPRGGAKVYGWAHCNSRRIQNEKNNGLADCITYLAHAMYLQFQGKDTYWTTGEIDPKTLRPKRNFLAKTAMGFWS